MSETSSSLSSNVASMCELLLRGQRNMMTEEKSIAIDLNIYDNDVNAVHDENDGRMHWQHGRWTCAKPLTPEVEVRFTSMLVDKAKVVLALRGWSEQSDETWKYTHTYVDDSNTTTECHFVGRIFDPSQILFCDKMQWPLVFGMTMIDGVDPAVVACLTQRGMRIVNLWLEGVKWTLTHSVERALYAMSTVRGSAGRVHPVLCYTSFDVQHYFVMHCEVSKFMQYTGIRSFHTELPVHNPLMYNNNWMALLKKINAVRIINDAVYDMAVATPSRKNLDANILKLIRSNLARSHLFADLSVKNMEYLILLQNEPMFRLMHSARAHQMNDLLPVGLAPENMTEDTKDDVLYASSAVDMSIQQMITYSQTSLVTMYWHDLLALDGMNAEDETNALREAFNQAAISGVRKTEAENNSALAGEVLSDQKAFAQDMKALNQQMQIDTAELPGSFKCDLLVLHTMMTMEWFVSTHVRDFVQFVSSDEITKEKLANVKLVPGYEDECLAESGLLIIAEHLRSQSTIAKMSAASFDVLQRMYCFHASNESKTDIKPVTTSDILKMFKPDVTGDAAVSKLDVASD